MRTRDIFPAWALSAHDALKTLETTREGLSEREVRFREKHFGLNSLVRERRVAVFGLVAKQFASPLIFILIAAAILTVMLREWIDATVIALAILINAGLGFYQEFRAENALEKLSTYVRERARVIRDGIEQEIDSVQLVPGDIIRIAYGQRVPADARLIVANNLAADESVLTGESLPVAKNTETLSEGTLVADRANMLHAGTLIVEGAGEAVVTATDSNTEIGRIAELVSTTGETRTPLQRALGRLAWSIFFFVASLVIVIFFLGLSRGESPYAMLLMAAAISVGAVPEALPIALTVILAVGLERLAKHKGIMRNLAAAETLGSATVVMTDKTGTLTEANMRLVDVLTRAELRPSGEARSVRQSLEVHKRRILESALWGADVTIENADAPRSEWRFAGRPFEASVARGAHERGIDVRAFIAERAAPLLVFNSTNKFSIVAGRGEAFVLGAPDILLARSKLPKDEFLALEERVHAISAEGKRLLGVAKLPSHWETSPHTPQKAIAKPEDAHDLDFLGVLVFQDPIRKDAAESVHKIERLGAKTVMVTGDLKGTAIAVARGLGWRVDEGQVLTGAEIRQLSDVELQAHLDRIRIFCRVTPEDKLRIGKMYRARGEIVAMTGDGVNDAPSLKAVDIGIALGSGSDVAKATADLVLLDDSFTTIVRAIEEGRRILENIRKVFVYLVSTCLGEVFLIGGALALGLPLPLTALQIIWVNFFTDSVPALSYAFDRQYAERREKRGVAGIFNTEVTVLTLGVGMLSSALLFTLYWYMLRSGIDAEHVRSTLFLCFSLYVLIVAFPLRNLRMPIWSYNPLSNTFLTASVAIGCVLTLATVYVPFLQGVFDLSTPPANLWWIVALWLAFNIAIVECAKLAVSLFRRYEGMLYSPRYGKRAVVYR